MIYITVFSSMILLRYSLLGNNKLLREIYPFVLWFLFFFAAFRFEVGCDWPKYTADYLVDLPSLKFSYLSGSEIMLPLYRIITFFLQSLELPYVWLNVAYAGVFFYGVSALVKRQLDPLGTLIFMFPVLIMNMPMGGIRQGAAVGIMCLAYLAFIDQKLTKYILLTVLAAFFHSSAIIFLALIPFVRSGFSQKRMFIAILLAIPFAWILYESAIGELMVYRYMDLYKGRGRGAEGALFRVSVLTLTALMFLIFFRKKWKELFPAEHTFMILGVLMMLAVSLLLPVSSIVADRLGYYLIPIASVFFARLPYLQIRQLRLFWVSLPYVILMLLFASWISLSVHYEVCYEPYNSWLLGIPEDSRLNFFGRWDELPY